MIRPCSEYEPTKTPSAKEALISNKWVLTQTRGTIERKGLRRSEKRTPPTNGTNAEEEENDDEEEEEE
ncbi:hypothetical protein Y032_0151g2840 [Ancylostoma ceylanicum]|uniref:Uncharacterized protein n=1 Tax=Ancylostoma ceylanicum TaxID=53326 RepID=A0A016T113_9BILA|nr:hypothetical protein Y032_0151g2840 [Ancylostoma ceylanicum]